MTLQIAVGSMSELKLDAVQEACRRLDLDADVIGVPTRFLVQPQPSWSKRSSPFLSSKNRSV